MRGPPVPERTPLILLPGLLCDDALWASQREALHDIAATTVADLTRDDTVTAMAAAVLKRAPPRFAVAGLSMGGYVAQEIMRQAPQRVTRLALLDTSPHADAPEATTRRKELMALARAGRFQDVAPRLMPVLVHPDRLGDETLTAAVMAMAERVGADAFIRQEQAIIGRPDGVADLAAIRVPTLVMCGREDALTPLDAHQLMARQVPGAELVVIDRCGHLSTVERPDAVNAALRRWLSR
jgi:pimeloyl-ACP methyl ester carboxylesterase